MTAPDNTNTIFSLAAEFINNTSRSVFLTGKAGTGKTTFLKYICANTHKNLAVAAPTGVAAINAGGMTLHSLFQLPLGVYLPGYHSLDGSVQVTNRHTLFKNLRLSNNKRDLLQELDLLIIDEVSMVRCDMLDAVDAILRMVRKSQLPFGGVQVLFIGDLYQLSPVAGNEEWNILKDHYPSPFFFHSKAVEQAPPLCIELTKIYRQNEQRFIDLLNNIRNNEVTEHDFELLNSRTLPVDTMDGFVTLTTHNYKADSINDRELKKLSGKAFHFQAVVEDDFPERNFPTEATLVLKPGARIMFIRNDVGEEKKYFNGKLATVNEITENSVLVQFDSGELFELVRETWRNIRYTYNNEDDEVQEEELGAFTQYPIRLAWAITIHKSQGLTFEKAIIDAGSSFAAGQVYVALSRCTSLEGMILQTPITAKQISTDPVVVTYSKNLQTESQLQHQLQVASQEYEKEYFLKLFKFDKVHQAIENWALAIPAKKLPDLEEAKMLSKKLLEKANELLTVASKTQIWIDRNFSDARLSGEYEKLVIGLKKSVHYFNGFLHDHFFIELQQHYNALKGKSKVRKYLNVVGELAMVIVSKGKKIRIASWQNEVLFAETGKIFTGFTELKNAKAEKEKGSSALETLALFKTGLTVQQIADSRNLANSTIEGHLLEAIRAGKLTVDAFVDAEKITTISKAIVTLGTTKTSELKAALGDAYSYSEIRAVLFYVQWVNPETHN